MNDTLIFSPHRGGQTVPIKVKFEREEWTIDLLQTAKFNTIIGSGLWVWYGIVGFNVPIDTL